MYTSVADRCAVVGTRVAERKGQLAQLESSIAVLKSSIEQDQKQELLLAQVERAVATLTGSVYSNSVGALTSVLNFGIATAYPREVQAVVSSKVVAGRPSLDFGLMDGGIEPIDPEGAHGGGLAQILGFLIRVVLIAQSGKRRFLMLDESFASVSSDLLPGVASLLRAVIDDLGFQIVLVTHQPELATHADIVYALTAPGVCAREVKDE